MVLLSKEDVLHETSRSDRSSMNVRTFRGLYFLLVEWFVRASLVTLVEVARKSRGIQKMDEVGKRTLRSEVGHGRSRCMYYNYIWTQDTDR